MGNFRPPTNPAYHIPEGSTRLLAEMALGKIRIKDGGLSKAFREIRRSRKEKVRLVDDILEAWKEYRPGLRRLIGDLRGVFNFRNWFAHRRYTDPKPGGKYDFDSIYDLASSVLNSFPLQETDNRPWV